MLQYLLIATIWLLPLHAGGQQAVLSTDATKILYAGFANKLNIAVPGYTCEDLDVSADCTITGRDCHYQVIPEAYGEAVFIVRSKKSNRILDTIHVPVISAPVRVKIALGVENSGQLLQNGPVVVSDDPSYLREAFHFADSFHITGFRVTLYRKSTDTVLLERTITGSRYDTETADAIAHAQPGDRLFLENIKAIGPDKKKRSFNSISYTFK